MVNVKVYRKKDKEGNYETSDDLLRRFKKACLKADIIKEWKKHEFFMKKSLRLKKKSEEHRKSLSKGKKRNNKGK